MRVGRVGSAQPESLAAFEARVDRRVPRVAAVTLDRPSAIVGPLSLLGGSRRVARIALAAAMIGAAGLLLAARFAGGGAGGAVAGQPGADGARGGRIADRGARVVPRLAVPARDLDAEPVAARQPGTSQDPQADEQAGDDPSLSGQVGRHAGRDRQALRDHRRRAQAAQRHQRREPHQAWPGPARPLGPESWNRRSAVRTGGRRSAVSAGSLGRSWSRSPRARSR